MRIIDNKLYTLYSNKILKKKKKVTESISSSTKIPNLNTPSSIASIAIIDNVVVLTSP